MLIGYFHYLKFSIDASNFRVIFLKSKILKNQIIMKKTFLNPSKSLDRFAGTCSTIFEQINSTAISNSSSERGTTNFG